MKKLLPLLLSATAVLTHSAHAQNATTTPVGAITLTMVAGTGTGRMLTSLSVPLDEPSTAAGQTVGRITSLTSNSISNSAAGWTAGQLSVAASPTLIRITSGSAIGRTFLVSSTPNTVTTVTIDASDLGATDLTTLGIATGASGDTYELLNAQTIATLFGTDTGAVLSGTVHSSCDQVQLMVSGALRSYYLNTSGTPTWKRVGPNTPSNNVVIKPDTGVNYSRLAASALQLTFTGTVPVKQRVISVKDGGESLWSVGWAADTTISGLGLQNLPSWTSGSATTGDTVKFLVSGAYRVFYFNGTNWKRVGPNSTSDSVVIPAGTTYTIKQLGSASSYSLLTQQPPYSL